MNAIKALLLASPMILSACAATVEIGRPFDPARFDAAVRLGVTTKADVRALLGDPVGTGVVVNEKGERFARWVYYFGKGTAPRLRDVKFSMLEVRFDRREVVQAYNWSSG
jgi:hypothetical protein